MSNKYKNINHNIQQQNINHRKPEPKHKVTELKFLILV